MAHSPIEISTSGVAVKGIAGTVAIGTNTQLEIRPKFASPDDDWQEDLLFLALFSAYGHVDVLREVSASSTSQNTLSDLLGKIILGLINRNSRRPLKTRRTTSIASFEPLSELDPEALLNPEDEGWRQTVYQMSFDNEWWSTIHAGIQALLPNLRDHSVAAELRNTISRWRRPRSRPSQIHKILPPRFAAWQTTYDLAFELARGASTAPFSGSFSTFGFTIDTWRTWEALIERALVMALGANSVALQSRNPFGVTSKDGKSSDLVVIPDAIVLGAARKHIVDAKYKGRQETGFVGISPSDRYEMLAFMHAAETDYATLLYPSLENAPVSAKPEELERSVIPLGTVRAVSLGIRGIGKPSGLFAFIGSLRAAIEPSVARNDLLLEQA
jgi:hypothetical protein